MFIVNKPNPLNRTSECVSVQQLEHAFTCLTLLWVAPGESQYCPCGPQDSKKCKARAWKQISVSVFWPPLGKQEQRRHVRNSELNSDLNLENTSRALWGRTMKPWIPNFKSPCWRQAVWTRLNISNAHQLPLQKVIFVVVFAPLGGFWAEWHYQALREAEFLQENDQNWYLGGRGPTLPSQPEHSL